MKTSSFKRYLAFCLSTVLFSCNTSFAAKRRKKTGPATKTTAIQKSIESKKKNKFYKYPNSYLIEKDSSLVFGNPKIFQSDDCHVLVRSTLLPSTTTNPFDTIYPFFVASLLRFAPYLIKPVKLSDDEILKQPENTFDYCLSFAYLSKETNKPFMPFKPYQKNISNDDHLIACLNKVLNKNYDDQHNRGWSGVELAIITVYLNAFINRVVKCDTNTVIEKLSNALGRLKEDISSIVTPLYDDDNNNEDRKKNMSNAYKKFYLEAVKAIDPYHDFELYYTCEYTVSEGPKVDIVNEAKTHNDLIISRNPSNHSLFRYNSFDNSFFSRNDNCTTPPQYRLDR